MVCGQILAPANLQNKVHMRPMYTKFLVSVYNSKELYVCFCAKELLLSFPSHHATPIEVHRRRIPTPRSLKASFTLKCFAVIGILFVTACFVFQFPCCVLRSELKNCLFGDLSLVATETHIIFTVAGYMTTKRDKAPTACI